MKQILLQFVFFRMSIPGSLNCEIKERNPCYKEKPIKLSRIKNIKA